MTKPDSIYLRPPRIEKTLKKTKYTSGHSSEYFYMAPEIHVSLFQNEMPFFSFENDLWALGCLFVELFCDLTPIFQAVDNRQLLQKIIELLGFPSPETAKKLKIKKELMDYLEHFEMGEILPQIMQCLSPKETSVISSLLKYDPTSRCPIEKLMQLKFFDLEGETANELADDFMGTRTLIQEFKEANGAEGDSCLSPETNSDSENGNGNNQDEPEAQWWNSEPYESYENILVQRNQDKEEETNHNGTPIGPKETIQIELNDSKGSIGIEDQPLYIVRFGKIKNISRPNGFILLLHEQSSIESPWVF